IVLGALDLTANTPNITNLVGGTDTFGLAAANSDGTTPDTASAPFLSLAVPHPANAVGVVARLNGSGLDELLFMNITGSPISYPALAVNRPGDSHQVSPQPLQVRGYLREPLFMPGASGAQTLTSLAPLNTWATYLHPGDATVTALFTPYTNSVTFSSLTSDQSYVWLLDAGLLSVSALLPGSFFPTYATADRTTNSMTISTFARAGAGAVVPLQIANVGSLYSLMSSLPGSDAT